MGTTTDLDGNFQLQVANENATLEISYLGFRTQTFEVSSSNNDINIVMVEDVNNLDEVIITGLASSIKRSKFMDHPA